MRRSVRAAGLASAVLAVAVPSSASAQAATREQILAFAKVEDAVSHIQDSLYTEMAQAKNKKDEQQSALREALRAQVAAAITKGGFTSATYQHLSFVVSTDPAAAKMYDSLSAVVIGKATATQLYAAAGAAAAAGGGGRGGAGGGGAPAAPVAVPAGAAGVHIGHVVNAFTGTPGGQGLLPTAMQEATTAATHAALGAKAPTDLAMMQVHAGHVINAIDPTIVTAGPGAQYGMKKAALMVADHIELAAKAQGASANIMTHSMHIASAARSAAGFGDQAIELAKQVQAAKTAPEAAALMTKLVAVTSQIVAGFDANGDGKIGYEAGEGGLALAQQHVTLLLNGEKP